jgi:hypothetical protein
MNDQSEYLYYRQLFDIFKAYTTPKLIRVLEKQGIKYMVDAKGKPFTTRSAIEGALEPESAVLSTAPEGLSEVAPSLS